MKVLTQIFILVLFISFLTGCAPVRDTSMKTVSSQTEYFQYLMERHNEQRYFGMSYQSLAYGEMTVFHPASFIQLDSVYTIKNNYIKKKDYRGLKKSGIEDVIPNFQAAAQQEMHLVKYEIEHLYQTSDKDSLHIYHDFFLFNYKDSILSITPFYDFKIPVKYKDLYYAYQFNYHFVDTRDLYISGGEQNFINFFKNREQQLIGEEGLNAFMNHTVHVMKMATKAQTIDFKEVSKWAVIDYFQELKQGGLTIEKIEPLFQLEEDEQMLGYEMAVLWTDDIEGVNKVSTFSFSPYLEILSVDTVVSP